MKPYFYHQKLKATVLDHNLKSGEILLDIQLHEANRYNPQSLILDFFKKLEIKTESEKFEISKLERKQAIAAIKYGLSTKLNYTSISLQFSEEDMKTYINKFFNFFRYPDCYTINTRFFQRDLDLNDFWETGGAILIDDEKIGIFWVNDLYDMF